VRQEIESRDMNMNKTEFREKYSLLRKIQDKIEDNRYGVRDDELLYTVYTQAAREQLHLLKDLENIYYADDNEEYDKI